MARIQLRRGVHANLPTSGMLEGEPLVTTDRRNLHVAIDATTRAAVTPAVDALATMGGVDLAADLLIIHDADSTGQKEKKITVQNFRTALNIPEGTTDEKVAVVAGGTAGYLYGTDGTDGVLRAGSGIQITKDASNGFITVSVGTIDGGTF